MVIGEKAVEKVRKFDNNAYIVDEVTNLMGGTCTVFQRMNERGDMLRIATTVKNSEGDRAIGTYIPAVNPDGKPNEVIATVMKGETYRGVAYVVNDYYLTAYHAMRNEKDEIVGVIYVGVKLDAVESLRETIMNTDVSETGYVFVLGGRGLDRGKYIISDHGKRDGENIWDAKDSEGNYFVRDMINKTIKAEDGKVTYHRYQWQNPGDDKPRKKLAATTYFEPWDWVIGVGIYKEDYKELIEKLEEE
jgi:hypothetical protein